MGGPTAHAHVQPHGSLAAAYHTQAGGFTHHGIIPWGAVLDELQDAPVLGFLIDHASDSQAALPIGAGAQFQQGSKHASERAFHV